jgi:hypothetical protein
VDHGGSSCTWATRFVAKIEANRRETMSNDALRHYHHISSKKRSPTAVQVKKANRRRERETGGEIPLLHHLIKSFRHLSYRQSLFSAKQTIQTYSIMAVSADGDFSATMCGI